MPDRTRQGPDERKLTCGNAMRYRRAFVRTFVIHGSRNSPVPAQAGTHVTIRTMPLVYLLAAKPYGTLYVGSTFELARRVWRHKTRAVPGFTAKYGVDRLVWFETHESLETALVRERQIKKWKRDWKINLIERENPHWADLYPTLSP